MEKITKINEELSVRKKITKNNTIISLLHNEKEVILSALKTDEYFMSNWTYNNNYIVAYSKGCMINQIPLTIEAAYNIPKKKLVDISSNRVKELLENMLVSRKYFDLKEVLSEINQEDLGLLQEREKGLLKDYLTSGNKDISQEEINNYILKRYFSLRKYKDLNHKLTVEEYRKIKEDIVDSIFCFSAMPQDLDNIKSLEKTYQKKRN